MQRSWLRRRWGPLTALDILLFAALFLAVVAIAWGIVILSR